MNSSKREIRSKAFFGLGFLLVILWLGLFLPAWSLDFFQAWVFWLTFSTSTIIVTIYLLKKDIKLLETRTKAGPTAEKEKSQKIIQIFASIFFILLVILPGFDHRYRWSNVPLYLVITGDIFVLLGFVIIFRVFKENSFASGIIETDRGQKVITTGPYRFVRHPMYTAGLLLILFAPLALGSYWALLFAFLLFVIIVIRLLYEEKFLMKNLLGYKEYCEKTRHRLIPFIW
ncbi:MAG TPA: isoprenylcysteine carboxylmethyltransferase family protein [Thermoplasmata archaeon]|jgi:protein-S-isoprenylcysteine O-methyltransferase Ste14|nr:MAG TPA: isoprenylcysteine carboxylmethyltransferase family protein [Thermoplasmata archaeon]